MACLESIRQGLEDIENLEKAGAICLSEQFKNTSSRKRCLWDHRVVYCADQIVTRAGKILALLEDHDGLRAEENAALAGQKPVIETNKQYPPPPEGGGREVWRAFYDRLKTVQDYYKAFGAQNEFPEIRDASYFVLEAIEAVPKSSTIFTAEEAKGTALDLTAAYSNFINCRKFRQHRELAHRQATLARLKRAKADKVRRKGGTVDELDLNDPEVQKKLEFQEIDYVRFIRTVLNDFRNIPRHCKYRDSDYEKYINELLSYLQSFYERSYPLVDHNALKEGFDRDFQAAWDGQKLPHWLPPTYQMTELYAPATDRLFATETACAGHVSGKKYQKALTQIGDMNQIEQESMLHDRHLARLEFLSTKYLELMSHLIEATIQYVRKKQTRNLAELRTTEVNSSDEEDTNAAFAEPDSDEEEPMKKVRNPLNLPLGWDGKPIPYWLYKLHGLGQEFKCEICGNHSYWGRRVFERHFQEWRHAFGMRCLKIPNTLHFKEITKIQDAIALYEKLRTETEQKSFLVDQEIEVEDSEGNVMTPQTYEDLKKQGII